MEKEILVSACLCGKKCRYNGKSVDNNLKLDTEKVLEICPEILGGLSVPRDPCEIINGNAIDVFNGTAKIISKNGNDYTKEYLIGVDLAIQEVMKNQIKVAYLKQNSPTCGFGAIYNGRFENKKIKGNGIFAEQVHKLGIKIISV